ncbi:MAG: STAS domain-containing protein [Butyrivibrio sp.]|nr:STAS domain-containing protein [Butyrivibrio sp.]
MKIIKKITGNCAELRLDGWLDTQAASELDEVIKNIGKDIENIEFDLKELEYISSAGVRQVVATFKKMDGHLKIKNTPEKILSVFRSLGIDKKIHFE